MPDPSEYTCTLALSSSAPSLDSSCVLAIWSCKALSSLGGRAEGAIISVLRSYLKGMKEVVQR